MPKIDSNQILDLQEINPHMALGLSESYESARDRAWLSWVKKAEKILGHDLDGDQDRDGYSLDFAHDFFLNGDSPEEYAEDVRLRAAAVL